MAEFDFKNAVALVTGAASGIGRATAVAFARAGAKVVVADIASGEETVQSIRAAGGEALFVKADVTSAEQVEALVRKAVDTYGRLDFAHNNAGILGPVKRTADYTEADWRRIINIHLKGVWLCMKYEIPEMIKRGSGAIVNTASTGGLVGFYGCPAYVAAKHGIIGLTKTAALEYARDGIRVNAVCPGMTGTQLLAGLIGDNADVERHVAAMAPVGRIGRPEEIADAVTWLCSARASFVTGLALVADGGLISGPVSSA